MYRARQSCRSLVQMDLVALPPCRWTVGPEVFPMFFHRLSMTSTFDSAESIATPPPLTLSSHGDFSCADPSNSSFGPVPDSTSPTGYEPNNLIEENSMEIKPMFFHEPSMTSTYDTSESIATPPPESDLDDEQLREKLASPLHLQERETQVPTDHELITPTEKTQCQVHLTSEQVQGDLQQCSHTKESRVKNHIPTEKVFPGHIEQFEGEMKHSGQQYQPPPL